MKFGPIDTRDSEGCYLAHSLRTDEGRIAKGSLITEAIREQLLRGGFEQVVGAQLQSHDVHEDVAAQRIADILCGPGVVLSTSRTGRVNLTAEQDGLCHFAADKIREANSVDEGITVATLPENRWVAKGRMVATVKIIPYAVDHANIDRVQTILAQHSICVTPAIAHKAELIQTELATVKTAVLDKTRRVIEQRIEKREVELTAESRCAHTVDALKVMLCNALNRQPDWVLVVGASAISDRADVIPQAIVKAGGLIDRYGIPVDPGNLLLLARHGDTRIIGLPGCARSPRYNGLDMVIDRMACEVPLDDQWLNSLSVGGLLTEIADRPEPRTYVAIQQRIGALILAAGSSRRAGSVNKLLATMNKTPLVVHVVNALKKSKVEHIIAVTGHEHERVEAVLDAQGVVCHFNAAHATGMGSSVVAGVSQLMDCDAVLVCLGDMPHVSTTVIDSLVDAYRSDPDKSIFLPVFDGRRGNPVLFARVLFDTLLTLEGDIGARNLLREDPDAICEVAVSEGSVFVDYDTKEELASLD